MDLNKINTNIQLMVKLMYRTGLRVNELVNMKHKNVYTENNYASINGKGSRERKIIIGKDLSKEIKSYLVKRKNK